MKKIVLFIVALVCMSNSECEHDYTYERDEQVYMVLDKGSSVGSHFNPFHKDNFEVSTDYYLTLKNVETGHVFVYKCRRAEEYYLWEKGKRYRHERFHQDYKYKKQ